jgi:hypothetical protein
MHATENKLHNLVGQICWRVVGGNGSGSMVTLHCGEKIPIVSSPPEAKKKLKFADKGEYCIFIQGCAWRLDHSKKMICTWRENEETIAVRMKYLEGLRIIGIDILNEANDLRIQFEEEYVLTLFCDQLGGSDAMNNYSIRFPGEWLVFGPGNFINKKPSRG